jgi:mono/diheme cytochrome c family protein
MKRLFTLLPALTALAAFAVSAATLPMDSVRGEKLFESQGCVQCHKLKGVGGSTASDLGRLLDRAYTPADLASTMWNHAPTMWKAIRENAYKVGDVDLQASADLFAAFYSARYFEMPGDAARGKRLFTEKSCAHCHGLSASPNPRAQPVKDWQTISDPVALVAAMWNHSPDMWSELSKKKLPWPNLTSQDLSDLLVYLRNISPTARGAASVFRITAGENGAQLFESKGCVACHKTDRQAQGPPLTLTAVAASMWNHASFLHLEPPHLDTSEMREVVSHYWANQFFESMGNPAAGRRIFNAKHCVDCHSGSGPGPVLTEKPGSWNGISMVSALWRHGPAMLGEMNRRKVAWPVFKSGEMADLIAYLAGKSGK